MDAADLTAGESPWAEAPVDEEPVPVCGRCGGLVGIFLDRGQEWLHFRGDGTTAGAQEIYEPGHTAEVTWRLPDEDPEEPGHFVRCPVGPCRAWRGTGTRRVPEAGRHAGCSPVIRPG